MTKEDVLKECTVTGNIVKLPDIKLDRKLYTDVAKSLELIGGNWVGNKIQGFLFNEDPTELLKQISNGDKRNLKKEFQFFATPDSICDELVSLACIQPDNKVLEPSAGQGAIINAIQRKYPINVDYCEIMDINRMFLKKINNTTDVGDDFLMLEAKEKYDVIIGNPPFAKNLDIQHIYKMYDCLKSGGTMVSVASNHWKISDNKTELSFREWLKNVGADIMEIEAGSFKSSGTNIATSIIIIDKN